MRLHFMIALTSVLGLALFSQAASSATAQQSSMKSCAANWSAMSAADKAKTKYKDYMTGCMKAPAQAAAAAPAPAMAMKASAPMKAAAKTPAPSSGSAKCKDGKTVTYKSRSGTCSGHGGVATWM